MRYVPPLHCAPHHHSTRGAFHGLAKQKHCRASPTTTTSLALFVFLHRQPSEPSRQRPQRVTTHQSFSHPQHSIFTINSFTQVTLTLRHYITTTLASQPTSTKAIKQKGVTTTTFLLVLVLAVVVAAEAAQLQDDDEPPTATAVGRHAGTKRRANKAASTADSPTHLHFYFHDTVSGKSPTAVRVVSVPATSPSPLFGMVNVMDDPLTEGPDLAAAAVIGRAQGLYMGSDQARLGFLQAMTLVFTAGDYNGSTLALLGRNCPLDAVRELPVVGGTGAFRFARWYALLRTHWLDFTTGADATVEYDVYVMH